VTAVLLRRDRTFHALFHGYPLDDDGPAKVPGQLTFGEPS
jgi:hypothetical protein